MKINKCVFVVISLVLITLLGFFVYGNSLKGKFIWDDNFMIRNNALIINSSGLTKIFTQDIGYGVGQKIGVYRPLQLVTYMLDYSIWGYNPIGYHITNIFLHILVGWLVFWLLDLLYCSRFICLFASLLFIVHPVHTEAVAYIAGRADILVTFFILLSFIFYIKYMRLAKISFYLIMLLSFSLALLSRENGLVFPVLLLCFHWAYKQKLKSKEFFPIILIWFFYLIFRLKFTFNLPMIEASSFFQRLPGFFCALSSYARILVFPLNLHMEYGLKQFCFFEPKVIIGIIISGLYLFAIIKQKNKGMFILFFLLWPMVTLLPVLNLYPVTAYMAEHWLYLPSIGFFSIFVYLLYKNMHSKSTCVISMLLIVSIFSYLTIQQTNYWLDPVVFFERTLLYAPDSYNAYLNLAVAYQNMNKPQEAIRSYKKAIVLYPKKLTAYVNLAALYQSMGRKEDAVNILDIVLKINPSNALICNNIGITYAKIKLWDKAQKAWKKALEINPGMQEAQNNLIKLKRLGY